MKKRKLLLLLAAVVCMLTLLTACGKEATSKSVLDYFAPSVGEDVILSDVKDMNGKIVSVDEENGLVAVEVKNAESTNLRVYDLNRTEKRENGKEMPIRVYETTSQSNVTLSVEFSYPLFTIVREMTQYDSSLDQDVTTYRYDVCFYTAHSGYANTMESGMESNDVSVTEESGLYVCKVKDRVFWTDRDGRILREFFADVANDYSVPAFTAEYKGYLYLHEWSMVSRRLQIFNKEGICQVMYSHPQNAILASVYPLNDGNVFVEEWLLLENAEKFDVLHLIPGENGSTYEKIDIVSKIVNFKTGEVTELDLNFSVQALESAYGIETDQCKGDLPFALSPKRNNGAVIRYFADTSFGTRFDLVVLDNEMNIVYTYAPKIDGDAPSYEMLPDGRVIVDAVIGVEDVQYLLDDKGNLLCRLPVGFCGVYGDYILAIDGVYDLSMKKVFDFEGSFIATEFGGEYEEAISFAGNLCLKLHSKLTDKDVYYVFDGSAFAPLAAGENEKLETIYEGLAYVVHNEEDKHYTLYAMDGTALLRTQGSMKVTVIGEMLLVESTVNGKPDGDPINYIVK